MPIKKAAFKALRQAKKREARARIIKNRLRKLTVAFRKAIEAKNKKEAEKTYLLFQKVLDKAAKSGVIKKNTASRKKGQAAKKLNLLKS